MPWFQKPPSTPEEIARSGPLPIPPEEVANLDERAWYQRVYGARGQDVPQLTVRAVLMGTVLGFVLAFTNVYVGLKAAWTVNVALTACIVSFSLWQVLLRVGIARSPMSILENNCMQSTASAAGYSTGQMITCGLPALLLLTVTPATPGGQPMPWWQLGAWIFSMAVLGVVMAIPMKRSMINHDRLKFPSGIAAAETLHSLYSRGAETAQKGRVLLYAALAAGVTPLLMDLQVRASGALLPSVSRALDWLPARGVNLRTGAPLVPSDWTMVLDHKLVIAAVGVLVGLRVAASMLLGALLLAYLVGPAGLRAGAVTDPGQAWLEIGLWVGAPMLVCAGLLSLLFSARALTRGVRGLASRNVSVTSNAEVPLKVFVAGVAIAGAAVVVMGHAYFRIPWMLGLLSLVVAFALSLAACRATGESDITPTGPMATLTQLAYGVLMPSSPSANLMTASITASTAASGADLLTDWKAGHLLGASPRRQFVAQLLGIVPGTVATVLGYYLLVPDATALTGRGAAPPAFPAPAAHMWLATARVMTRGVSTLHPLVRQAIVVGAVAGLVLTLLERLPPRVQRWLPSATGLGMGFVFPFQYPLSFFLGALVAWIWARRSAAQAETYAVPLASGVIAGESLVGVVVTALNNFVLRR
jgi:putative OPT family oligopeptide transporter